MFSHRTLSTPDARIAPLARRLKYGANQERPSQKFSAATKGKGGGTIRREKGGKCLMTLAPRVILAQTTSAEGSAA